MFLGHGSPMNVLQDNAFTRAWGDLGRRLPRPRAIVCISAHWESKGVLVNSAPRPRTIHDFYNFPPELYAITYPAPGDPGLAKRIEALLAPTARADLDGWGFDHGAWGVLKFLYPEADIPVVMLSQDLRKSAAEHYAVGQALAPLRDEGVMILGSGNIVHNLRRFDRSATTGLDWAERFNEAVKARVLSGDHAALINYPSLGPDAPLSVPEAEHYHPLLYVLGARRPEDRVELLTDQVLGSLSMTSVVLA